MQPGHQNLELFFEAQPRPDASPYLELNRILDDDRPNSLHECYNGRKLDSRKYEQYQSKQEAIEEAQAKILASVYRSDDDDDDGNTREEPSRVRREKLRPPTPVGRGAGSPLLGVPVPGMTR